MAKWLWQNKSPVLFTAIALAVAAWIVWFLTFPPLATLTPERLKEEVPSTPKELLERLSLVPHQLIQLHDSWLNEAVFWKRVHYTLAVLSVVLSTLVASGASLLGEKPRNFIAVSAAIATGLLTSLSPYKTHEDFIGAWRMVNVTKLEYLAGMRDVSYLVSQVGVAESSLRESRHFQQAPELRASGTLSPTGPTPTGPPPAGK